MSNTEIPKGLNYRCPDAIGSRQLNGRELACLEDKEYIRLHAKVLSGYELTDKELDNMISEIKQSQ